MRFKNYLNEAREVSKQITDDIENFMSGLMKKYKIKKEDIEKKQGKFLVYNIKLPDVINGLGSEDEVTPENLKKLKKDLENDKIEHPFLIIYFINDYYMSNNRIELKFSNVLVTPNTKILYHVTKKNNLDSILKNGLVPQKGSWEIGKGKQGKTSYKAVFLTTRFRQASKILSKKEKLVVLKIDVSGLKLYSDELMDMEWGDHKKDHSFISFEKIKPNRIEVFKEL